MGEDEVKRRYREQPGQHRTRAKTVRGARTQTKKEGERSRMQEGYDVYTSATGKKVGGGVGASDRQSRKDYQAWARTPAGKKAWQARKKPKPKPSPKPTPTPKATNPINVTKPPKPKKPKPKAGPGVTAQDAGDALADSE